MSGELEPGYVLARRVLLDALEALRDHRDALILVGAQAVYLRTDAVHLAVSPFTSDADLALDPRILAGEPSIRDLLVAANFVHRSGSVGVWEAASRVTVDLLVPAKLSPAGRRSARLGRQGKELARKTDGLEGVVVDNDPMSIRALAASDPRRIEIAVAGPAALLVAKLCKIAERAATPARSSDKDAVDVYRLLLLPSEDTSRRYERILTDSVSAVVARTAVGRLRELFGSPESRGSRMAARALFPFEDPERVAASCAALAQELLTLIHG